MKKISLIIICLLLCICTGCGSFSTECGFFSAEHVIDYYIEGTYYIANISKIMDSKIVDTTKKDNTLNIVFENGVEYTGEIQITDNTLISTSKIQFDELDDNKIQLFLIDAFGAEDKYLADEFYDAYLNGNDYKKEISSNMMAEMNLSSLKNDEKLFVFTLTGNW